jgi:hypothetical protein
MVVAQVDQNEIRSAPVTIARSLSDTFAGIAPGGVVGLHRRAARRQLAAVLLARGFWTSTKSASL